MSNADIEHLKAEAAAIGAKHHHRAGADKIKAAIEARQIEISLEADEQVSEPSISSQEVTGSSEQEAAERLAVQNAPRPMTEAQYQEKIVESKRLECNRLVRVRVQCMNPNKKAWAGEIISVGSSKLGTFKKFVPFSAEEPYHIPKIIYEEMKVRKCRMGTSTKGPNGQVVHRNKLIPEFSIEVLPPLSRDELKSLAQRQAMAAGSQGADDLPMSL